ncbi:MAG TPA: SDR family oxidoreductase [Acidilobales archaeon]|nr:SDR family oxidoreductase [Acidilobales archaeon]
MIKNYIFITGGDRGIGRAIALRFARDGYIVVFSYFRRKDMAEETLKKIKELGSSGFYIQMDVGSEESVRESANLVGTKVPYINVLVNNAGILHVGKLEETKLSDWEEVIRVNLTGVFLVTKYFLPLLRRSPWASIVNIASIAGQTGHIAASAAYAASKAGVIGLTRRLATELAPHIRVNAVAPSFVETDMVRPFIQDPEKRRRVIELHPLKDIAKPEDVAEAVYFLATPASRFITGQVLGVNGGRLIC